MRDASERVLIEAYKRARTRAPEDIEARLASVLVQAEAGAYPSTHAIGPAHTILKVMASALVSATIIAAIVFANATSPKAPSAAMQDDTEPVATVQPMMSEAEAISATAVTQPSEQQLPPATERPLPSRRRAAPTKLATQSDAAIDDGPAMAELQLITNARRALRRGEHAIALELLEQHAREFEKGALAHERNVSRLQALCALGLRERAAELGQAFAKSFPESPIGQRWHNGCPTDRRP